MAYGGTRKEFEALVRPHLDWMYRLAFRYTGHRENAEDLVQELLVRLLRNPGRLPDADAPRGWLMRALHNAFIDQRRHQNRTPLGHLHPQPWDELFADTAGSGTPEAAAHADALKREIVAALYSLDNEHRAILVLHDMEGHSLPELSESLQIPLGTLKSRLFRARRKLRTLLEAGNHSGPADVMIAEAS